jgi:hypothetical protein
METEFKEVSLSTLGKGAAAELFAEELGKVLANIADVNTDAKAPREIKLSVKIIPRETRDYAALKITCTSKLAALKQYETSVHMGIEGGRVKAFEEEIRQGKLDLDEKVRDISEGRKA